jgi:D-alanyl-D-alanine carboxypeptidase
MHLTTLTLPLIIACGGQLEDTSNPEPSTTTATSTSSSTPEIKDLSDLLRPIRRGADLAALGAVIVDGQGTRAIGVHGDRQYGADNPVTIDDPWHLGSDTKAMTATLVAVLVEEGSFSWETLVTEVWPDAHEGWAEVTAEDLLQHRGGATGSIPGDHPDLWTELYENLDSRSSRAAFTASLVAMAPDETTGEYTYSNAGYMMVGAMLESTKDQAWEDLITDKLFAPLEMTRCGFGAPEGDAPWGHTPGTFEPQPVEPGLYADNPPGLGPAGTVHCPLEDWGRFASAHLRQGSGDSPLLSAASFSRMHEPNGHYGHGWIVDTESWADGALLVHAGSNTLWLAYAYVAPNIDRAYLIVTNHFHEDALAAADETLTALLVLDEAL